MTGKLFSGWEVYSRTTVDKNPIQEATEEKSSSLKTIIKLTEESIANRDVFVLQDHQAVDSRSGKIRRHKSRKNETKRGTVLVQNRSLISKYKKF